MFKLFTNQHNCMQKKMNKNIKKTATQTIKQEKYSINTYNESFFAERLDKIHGL